ncbi:hypothetical protein PSTG_14231 [Puccinia striiformis f. sp. tritici PST-78]|uniref:Uncharacterized protein n=1 Tax=Puccinia striiformis f. sp. tritici PST-78 TaxID=1165861 RepID=A0A0L0UZE6_9BASI|nr:hypothetical protein PSTG_14231 [Puccinia striiformis f. sp. tritici PST-78]
MSWHAFQRGAVEPALEGMTQHASFPATAEFILVLNSKTSISDSGERPTSEALGGLVGFVVLHGKQKRIPFNAFREAPPAAASLQSAQTKKESGPMQFRETDVVEAHCHIRGDAISLTQQH